MSVQDPICRRLYGPRQISIVVAGLLKQSCWLEVTPLPEDLWEVAVKSDAARHLPDQAKLPPEAVLSIRYTGGGIHAEALSRIFNPFFTTKAGGTGLGLAITHRIIVDHHGGSIEVHNEAGVGAAFTVSIPLAEPSQAAPSAPDSEEAMEEER
jgi:signal transduction histidine kinase